MAKHAPAHDPMDFATRLKEAMADAGDDAGYGAGSRLARRFKVSVPSATAWLNGRNLPDPPRARRIAAFYGVRFEWLYFGEGAKRGTVADNGAATYTTGIKLTAEEQAVLRGYQAADSALRAVVDAALGVKHPLDPPRGKKR